MIDQSVEGVEGEFSQAVGRVLEGFEEVLVSGFPGLGFFDLCGELVDAGLEFVVPVGEVIVALLVGALVESSSRIELSGRSQLYSAGRRLQRPEPRP